MVQDIEADTAVTADDAESTSTVYEDPETAITE